MNLVTILLKIKAVLLKQRYKNDEMPANSARSFYIHEKLFKTYNVNGECLGNTVYKCLEHKGNFIQEALLRIIVDNKNPSQYHF